MNKLRKQFEITTDKLLDFISPNWRTFVHDAVGYLEERKILSSY